MFRDLPAGSYRKLPRKENVWGDLIHLQRQHSETTGMICVHVYKVNQAAKDQNEYRAPD